MVGTVPRTVALFLLAFALSCGGGAGSGSQAQRSPKKERADRSGPTPSSAAAGTTPDASTTVTWKIVVSKDLTLDERVCWSGLQARRVIPEMTSAFPFVKATRDDGSAIAFDAYGAPVEGTNGCINLAVDLKRGAATLADEAALTKSGDAVYGSLDIWLWRPEPWPEGLRGRLVIETPPEISVSLPFSRDAEGAYSVPYSAWKMMARAAIGKLTLETIDVAGAKIDVALLPNAAPNTTRPGIRRFLEGAATAVATLDGKMPAGRVQVLLRPGGGGWRSDPVRFGMAMRGGGSTVMMLVSSAATDAQLYGEWIGVHELSHLWLPPIDQEASWLPEGFASYYQCVLRSRVGMYDEKSAWDELLSGFDRGRSQAGRLPLKSAQRPSFMHIYWGGAAIMLKLDVDLRKGGSSLDAVVAKTRREHPADDDDPSLDELIARLSKAAGKDLKTSIDAWLEVPFPDTSAELKDLGVVRRGGKIFLDDSAPLAKARVGIAGKR